jgi:hypothetical protein
LLKDGAADTPSANYINKYFRVTGNFKSPHKTSTFHWIDAICFGKR